jgi:CDGSH iron-sulfur domain-containing protein 3
MTVEIHPSPNGPLKIQGDFKIIKADGSVAEHKGETAFLCRCGHSANKPFCDGSHKAAEFKAD